MQQWITAIAIGVMIGVVIGLVALVLTPKNRVRTSTRPVPVSEREGEARRGKYLNPRLGTKEQFLKDRATHIRNDVAQRMTLQNMQPGFVFVCLVANAGFSAAIIVDSEEELRECQADLRPKLFFLVKEQELVDEAPVDPLEIYRRLVVNGQLVDV